MVFNYNLPAMEAVPPFRLDLTVWALRRRAKNVVDVWSEGKYTRVVPGGKSPVAVSVTQQGTSQKPSVVLTLESSSEIMPAMREFIARRFRRSLGLDIDLAQFYRIAGSDKILAPLVKQFMGLKPPRFHSLFEALINAVACQQVSLDSAIQTLNRFCTRFGPRYDSGLPVSFGFPQPASLACVTEEDIMAAGFSRQKAKAIIVCAAALVNTGDDLEKLEKMPDGEAIDYLSGFRGVGRWSSEYVLLRGLGRLEVFPGDDVGAKNNLTNLFHLSQKPDYDRIKELTSAWSPYQGMVYFHLLLDKLHLRGDL
jgi:DNA-3-methyladenine glycosylase II